MSGLYPLINVRQVDEARGYVWDTNGLQWVPAVQAAAGGGSLNISAGTTSNNLTAITFANSNGVSFGLNGSTLTGSVAAAGGAQTAISGLIVSDATYTSGTVSFSNQANVTIGSSVTTQRCVTSASTLCRRSSMS